VWRFDPFQTGPVISHYAITHISEALTPATS
jgi:hypothetical protein